MTQRSMKKQSTRKVATDWPFDQPPNAAAITLRRIVMPQRGAKPRPILMVCHDAEDHCWQFLDGEDASPHEAAVVGMGTMLELDPTLATIASLRPGWMATRDAPGGKWRKQKVQ